MKSNTIETQFVRYIAPILAALFLAGCSGSPSERAGRQIVEAKVRNESEGLMKLVSFRKTNATDSGSQYNMEYEAEVVFTDDATVHSSEGGVVYGGALMGPFWARRGSSKGLTIPGQTLLDKKKGEKMKRSGILAFEKTEKGWRGPDGNVY